MRSFPLAPMARTIAALTWALMALPLGFVGAAAAVPQALPLGFVAVFVAAIYGLVWVWFRPGRFDVGGGELAVVAPWRRRVTPLSEIEGAEVLDMAAFRQRYPNPMRVGAGGLWGGFGWLTTGNGWVEFYISRFDGLVLVRRRDRAPLLISPNDPEGFVAALRR